MTGVYQLVQNPAQPTQMYALWDTGRIDPYGGALPILDGPNWFNTTYQPGRALHITDWNGPSGYVLDAYGGFTAFGAAPPVGTSEFPNIMSGVPYTGGIAGVQNAGPPKYVDFSMNPDNSGQGYVCDYYGRLYHFGGATACPRSGSLWTQQYAQKFDMQWEPFKRSVILDYYGGRNQDFPYVSLARDGYYQNRHWARDMVITDWGTFSSGVAPSGYLLTADGLVYEWGPNKPQDVFGFTSVGARGTQVTLGRIQAADPLTMVQVAVLGQQTVYTVSTPPVVVAGGLGPSPASVVTDTTRPDLSWSYSDAESDSQDQWQLVVWPQSWVDTHVMTNPRLNRELAAVDAEGFDSTTRGVTPSVDLANGNWRMYVRAMDRSGKWSPWSNRGWAQNVPLPGAPANLTATVDRFHVNLLLTVAAVEVGQLAVFEASDDAGLTWAPVRGAEAVPVLTTTVTATDYDIPLGQPRMYQARTFFAVPRTVSPPSPTRTVTVEFWDYVITSTDDPELGGTFAVTDLAWSRPRSVGVYEPLGAEFPIVINDGRVRARRGTISIDTWDAAEYRRLVAVLSPASTLLVRDQFGEAVYCRVVGDWEEQLRQAAPLLDENTGLRHAHVHDLPLVEVARPSPLVIVEV